MNDASVNSQKRVLFVCLGNICRSPAAEGVLRALADKHGVGHHLVVESAGTSAWHEGEPPDPRMQTAAARRGYHLTSLARQVRPADFAAFDLIVAMDEDNRRDLLSLTEAEPHKDKVRLLSEFLPAGSHFPNNVPDPYYGGRKGFEFVLDMVEAGCKGILDHLFQKST